jgi:hypothetical protein
MSNWKRYDNALDTATYFYNLHEEAFEKCIEAIDSHDEGARIYFRKKMEFYAHRFKREQKTANHIYKKYIKDSEHEKS